MKRYSLIIMAMIVVALTSTVCHAQRYRSGTHRMSYDKDSILITPTIEDYKYVLEARDMIQNSIPFSAQRMRLHIYFTDGTTPIVLENAIWEDFPDPNTTYFYTTKKQTKLLTTKEISIWKFILFDGTVVTERKKIEK